MHITKAMNENVIYLIAKEKLVMTCKNWYKDRDGGYNTKSISTICTLNLEEL
jgi:hypothetical protein